MTTLTRQQMLDIIAAGGSVALYGVGILTKAEQVPAQAAMDAGTYDAYSDQANQAALLAARLSRPNARTWRKMAANGSGTMQVGDGMAAAALSTGTASARSLSATNPWAFEDYTSAATLNAQAGITGGTTTRWSQRPLFQCRAMLGTSLAVLRAHVGYCTNWASVLATDTPGSGGFSGALFRFSTAAGDAAWQCVTFNGTTQTVTPTSVAPVLATSQAFEISDDGSNTVFKINGVQVASTPLTRPTSTITVRAGAGLQTLEAVAKNIDVASVYEEIDG
jgi:hypothetical protein